MGLDTGSKYGGTDVFSVYLCIQLSERIYLYMHMYDTVLMYVCECVCV